MRYRILRQLALLITVLGFLLPQHVVATCPDTPLDVVVVIDNLGLDA
jgi:hypothetical protein